MNTLDKDKLILEELKAQNIDGLTDRGKLAIRELAELIAQKVDYKGSIKWDATKPDGMPRKCVDVSHLNALGYTPKISLEDGIKKTIEEYRAIISSLRVNN